MAEQQTPTASTPEAPAPATPAVPSPETTTTKEPTLQEWRSQRAKREAGEEPAETTPAPKAARSPLAGPEEPPEPDDLPDPSQVKPPEQGKDHRWKDPETGITLDMRRRDHRRMKRALEERAAYARRAMQAGQPAAPAQPPAQAQRGAQPGAQHDPEPTFDQFAQEADPYAAYVKAQARWVAREEFRQQTAQRTDVERAQRVVAQVNAAQSAWDAKLPDVKTRYPDFDDAYNELHSYLERVPLQVRREFVSYLLSAPQQTGHDIAYYLGNHPEELDQMFQAPNGAAHLRAIGAIEARVQAAMTPATAPAPQKPAAAPMKPVGSAATTTTFSTESNPGDLTAYRKRKGVRGGYAVA